MRLYLPILLFALLFCARSEAQLVADFSATVTTLDCNTSCTDFTDLTTGGTPSFWQWSFPGASPSSSNSQFPTNICYSADGLYDVTLIVSDGINSDTLTQTAYITRQAVPGASVSGNQTIPFGVAVPLDANGGVSYSWTPPTGLSDPSAEDPLAAPQSTTTYSVTITGANGCTTTLETTVFVIEANNYFVPSAFSPNSDGANDVLYLYGNNLTAIEFSIYDRWGEKVFSTTNPDKGWDGTYKGEKALAGVYTYVAVITYGDGARKAFSGKTSLVR